MRGKRSPPPHPSCDFRAISFKVLLALLSPCQSQILVFAGLQEQRCTHTADNVRAVAVKLIRFSS